jgi:uncharacterized membrane protein
MLRLTIGVGYLFSGALLFALPTLSRREFLFAVRVSQGFRSSLEAQRAVAKFRFVVIATVVAGLCAQLAMPLRTLAWVAPIASLATILIVGLAFYWQRHRLKPMAVPAVPAREAELTDQPERLPWFAWLGIGPVLLIAAAAVFLYLNWDSIPARFPVHYGAHGQPNRWATRSVKGVYGPLLYGAELSVFLAVMGLATWYGSRRSSMRRFVLGLLVSSEYLLSTLFTMIVLQPVLRLPIWVFVLIPCFIIPMLIATVKRSNQPRDAPDPTPDDCWKGGLFYYNPNDAALGIEARTGFGIAFNFANPWVWGLLAALVLLVASAFFVLP